MDFHFKAFASSSATGTSFSRFVFLETYRLLQHLFPAVVSLVQGELVPFPRGDVEREARRARYFLELTELSGIESQ